MSSGISMYVGNTCKFVLFNDILFVSDVIEIYGVKVSIGKRNEPILVIEIYRPPDKIKFPQYDEIMTYILTRFGADNRCFSCSNFDTLVLIIMRTLVSIIH